MELSKLSEFNIGYFIREPDETVKGIRKIRQSQYANILKEEALLNEIKLKQIEKECLRNAPIEEYIPSKDALNRVNTGTSVLNTTTGLRKIWYSFYKTYIKEYYIEITGEEKEINISLTKKNRYVIIDTGELIGWTN